MNSRTCAAEGCSRAIHPSHSFCRDHWAMVPVPHRKAIWGCVEDSTQEWQAIKAAAEVVAQAEGRREPSAFPDFQKVRP